MAYRYEKESKEVEAIVISGFEQGIAPSPLKGIANMQGVNISTETGEAMCSFDRVQQSQGTVTGGTLTVLNTDTLTVTATSGTLTVGTWITVGSGITGLPAGTYYVINSPSAGTVQLSSTFQNSSGNTSREIINYLLTGGGGAGGVSGGSNGVGGGGAGEVITGSAPVIPQGYSIVIGAGGTAGGSGASTTGLGFTAIGGSPGLPSSSNGTGGASGNGFTGGTFGGAGLQQGGGGAGASMNGGNSTGGNSGNGGDGISSSISGTATFYGGGGGGSGSGGTGGQGGGGRGGIFGLNTPGVSGTANTGGGGGGSIAAGGNTSGGSGVVIISYPTGTVTATGGTITTSGGNTIHTFTASGTWTVSAVSESFILTGFVSGSASFTAASLGLPIQSASELYTASDGTTQSRYYILDNLGQVWIHDTFPFVGITTPNWFLSEIPNPGFAFKFVSGLAVLNGWLTITFDNIMFWKNTSTLDVPFSKNTEFSCSTIGFHATLVGHQGKLYVTDGNFIMSLFPNSSLLTGGANIQSEGSYTAVTTTCTITNIIGGSMPFLAVELRVPVVFFINSTGTLPTSITPGTIYYVEIDAISSPMQFQVYTALTGGSPLDMQTGASGPQYFNTFYPLLNGQSAVVFSPQRLNLPFFEVAQCMAELGNTVIIGGRTNTVYPWDQVSALPSDLIFLPENNVATIVTVNNSGYIFAGQKGNVYITNGSSVSLAVKVPDYCAGIAGSPSTYIEPYFTWGAAMYLRGRVYFSILDQTATKAGNCGGVWSFVPTQNFYIGQDVGIGLRVENQNSYGTYNGVATVLLGSYVQTQIGPQYWSGWYSSLSSPTYGIDFSDTIPGTQAVIEYDLIPTGTLFDKDTFQQIEYKLSAPLAAGESVAVNYRQNGTDAFASAGVINTENATGLSGLLQVQFQKGQWLQLQSVSTPLNSSSSSFVRFTELRIR